MCRAAASDGLTGISATSQGANYSSSNHHEEHSLLCTAHPAVYPGIQDTAHDSTLKNMTPVPAHLRENVCFFEGVKNSYLTYKNLGILYQERGEWNKSAQAFENALRFTPPYFSPHYKARVKVALGEVYIQKGRLDEAFTLLMEARPDTPKPSEVDNLLGIIAIKLSEKEKATLYFKRALLENKDYAPAHHNLGILYMESDEVQMGIQELMEAVRLNPNYRSTLAQYGISPYDE